MFYIDNGGVTEHPEKRPADPVSSTPEDGLPRRMDPLTIIMAIGILAFAGWYALNRDSGTSETDPEPVESVQPT